MSPAAAGLTLEPPAHGDEPRRARIEPRPPWAAWLLGALLAAAGPTARLVQFLSANRAEIARPGVVVRTAIISSAVLVALMFVVSRAGHRSPVTVGAGIGVIGFFFFTSDIFGASALLRMACFVVVVGLCAVAAASAAQRTWVAAIVAALAVAYVAIAGIAYASWRDDHRAEAATVQTSAPSPGGPRPSVYYFVLDGHARDDVLRELYPEDDPTMFNESLAEMGFTVDPAATANYPQTIQSVPSTLEQALIIDEGTPSSQVQMDRTRTLQGANKTVNDFRALGYQYLQTDVRRHDSLRCDENVADGCLAPRQGAGVSLGEVERSLVELTPVGPLVLDGGIIDSSKVDMWPTDVVDSLIAGGWVRGDRPRFVYAHVIAPHPPYVRDGECEDISPVGDLGEGWGTEHRGYYLGQVQCLRTDLERAIGRLIEADPTAIVVLQSDHGPGFGVDSARPLSKWTNEQLRTRFGVFRAWRLPQPCVPTQPAASSLVNTFRVINACVRGTTPELAVAQSYQIGYGSNKVEALLPGVIAPGRS